MKLLGLLLLSVAFSGCSTQYAHDPRAAVVGPAYLEYIANHPRDCSTEYYYPSFRLTDDVVPPPQPIPLTTVPPTDALLIRRPPATKHAQREAGKGYPHLEAKGIPVFTHPED